MTLFLHLLACFFFLLSLGTCTLGNAIQQATGAVMLLIAFVLMLGAFILEQLQGLRRDMKTANPPVLTDKQPIQK